VDERHARQLALGQELAIWIDHHELAIVHDAATSKLRHLQGRASAGLDRVDEQARDDDPLMRHW
jgi:hypothetical protein